MNTVDSSVVVAAFARWHEQHAAARTAVTRADALIAHVALETYSVLTRLPPPRRADGRLVVEFLGHHFPDEPISLGPVDQLQLLDRAVAAALDGGAIYDALVATTAAAHEATLLSLDRRAVPTYRACGARHELIA